MSYLAEVLADEPILYYAGTDTVAGTDVADLSPHGRTGSIVGTVTKGDTTDTTVPIIPRAYTSGGGRVTLPDPAGLFVQPEGAIEVWYRPTSNTFQILTALGDASGDVFSLCLEGSFLKLYQVLTGTTAQIIGSVAPSLNTWHHMVVCWSLTPGGRTKYWMYQDNTLVQSYDGGEGMTLTGRVPTGGSWLAGVASQYPVVGQAAHFAYYDQLLTASRVAAHWNARTDAGAAGWTPTTYDSDLLATDAPLIYLPFDDSTANDQSGHGHNAVLVGAADIRGRFVGPHSILVNRDGAGDYGDYGFIGGNMGALINGTATASIEAWFYPTYVQPGWPYIGAIAAINNPSIEGSLLILRYGNAANGPGYLEFSYSTTGATFAGVEGPYVAPGHPHHIVGTFDHGVARLYLDGTLVGTSGSTSSDLIQAAGPLWLGAESTPGGAQNGRMFNGLIDNVALYGTALSADRIAAHWTNGLNIVDLGSSTAAITFGASADHIDLVAFLDGGTADIAIDATATLDVAPPIVELSGDSAVLIFPFAALNEVLIPLPAPSLLARGVSYSQIELDWLPSFGFADYEIQGSDDGGTWAPLTTVNGLGTYLEDGLDYSQTRYYRIRVLDLAGPGPWSPPVAATTKAAPAPGEPIDPPYVAVVIPRPLMKKVVIHHPTHYGWTNTTGP